VRITIGTRDQMQQAVSAVNEALAEIRKKEAQV
jgi:histidinol-phosphate/aromatic aminotransferase/cobyric acid decarboxylase-like protein